MEPIWAGVVSVSKEAYDWHQETQFPLMPWSSQARGFFSGRFTPDNREDKGMVRVYYNEANFDRFLRRERGNKKPSFFSGEIRRVDFDKLNPAELVETRRIED